MGQVCGAKPKHDDPKPPPPAPAPAAVTASAPATATPAPPAAQQVAPPAALPVKADPLPVQVVAPTAVPIASQTVTTSKMAKFYIIIYTCYGHIYKMAEKVKEGIDSIEGCEGVIYQVAETLPEDVLAKMHAPPKPDVPVIHAKDLPAADGLVFGFPTRFGAMCAQMKSLFDATGGLWASGALVGKPCTMFTSTAQLGGGQETTILTSLTQVVHHGMIYIPPGYSEPSLQFTNEVRGGSPWGAGTLAGGDGSRQPSENELAQARHQGKHFAMYASKICKN